MMLNNYLYDLLSHFTGKYTHLIKFVLHICFISYIYKWRAIKTMLCIIYIRYNKYHSLFFTDIVSLMVVFILFLISFSNING